MTTGLNVVVVYESVFGNTHAVAGAIGEGIAQADPNAEVRCLPAGEAVADVVGSADLLVVGAPTHMHGMSWAPSRSMAMRNERDAGHEDRIDADAEGPGIRDWLNDLPHAAPSQRAAAFDTRADLKHAGSAADGIVKRLRRHGYPVPAAPASFVVDDTTGPLHEGELDRARVWGAALVADH